MKRFTDQIAEYDTKKRKKGIELDIQRSVRGIMEYSLMEAATRKKVKETGVENVIIERVTRYIKEEVLGSDNVADIVYGILDNYDL